MRPGAAGGPGQCKQRQASQTWNQSNRCGGASITRATWLWKRWQKWWLIAGCVGFYYFALVERGIRDRPGPKPVNQPEPASQQQQQQQQQQGRESSIFCPISKKIFDIYSVVNQFTLASIYYIYIYIASRVDPAFVVRLQGNRDYSLNYTIRLCNNYAAAL